jgi:hypothetical protein
MTHSFNPSDYATYKQAAFSHRWLRYEHLQEKLISFRGKEELGFYEFGQSEEGRKLERIEFGTGPLKIMLWSQMHGNEPTATMALIDLLQFLTSKGDLYDNFRKQIATNFTLQVIPMLNPDGAERFTRRNALQIDMNRDALRQQTLEIKAFVELFNSYKPHWAFNLHDQRNFFSAGNSKNTATISFLAASSEVSRKINPVRAKSMSLISTLAEVVEELHPGHCGRYTDEYYPRALGEFCHRQEVPCVLVESGAYPNDANRDTARKLNFLIFLRAFEELLKGDFEEYNTDAYHSIPENGKSILDLIIRNCILEESGSTVDLGFMTEEVANDKTKNLERRYRLTDIGDLSFQYGMMEKEGGRVEKAEELQLEKLAQLQIQVSEGVKIQFSKGVLVE